MEFSFSDLIEVIDRALRRVFGAEIPDYLATALAWGVLFLCALSVIYLSIWLISGIIRIIKYEIVPLFYNAEEKVRLNRRRLFADHVEHRIRQINNQEEWSHNRYSELEAEVEAEGERKSSWVPYLRRQHTLRHEYSLSKALKNSTERLIVLEGSPGSGKSVALRQIAIQVTQSAMKSRNLETIIPIYVNLKGLKRNTQDQPINQALIREFVLDTLQQGSNREVVAFLEEEFDMGLRLGTWLFLFDSFDEIPEILSATESNELIRGYSEAISDFLHTMNRCRGIIASREYRGPHHLGWPRFHILPLTEIRQIELIRQADLRELSEERIIGELANAPSSLRTMASNPMFLGLLCEFIQKNTIFPNNSFVVYEEYIQSRINRDATRLISRYNLTQEQLRDATEKLAFCMTADSNLGLSPSRISLLEATKRQGFDLGQNFYIFLDALEFILLARSDSPISKDPSSTFSFAHRRFQEYFATSLVIRHPDKVPPRKLLTDGNWRETAVVLFQTQPIDRIQPIITEAITILSTLCTNALSTNNIQYAFTHRKSQRKKTTKLIQPFSWPPNAIHILGILQEGFSNHLNNLSATARIDAGNLLYSASTTGTRVDQKWSLEVAGIVPEDILEEILTQAFTSNSRWLFDTAFQQVARLQTMPLSIERVILKHLHSIAADGRLHRERHAIRAYLLRLTNSKKFVSTMDFLLSIPRLSFFMRVISSIIIIFLIIQQFSTQSLLAKFLILLVASIFFLGTFEKSLKIRQKGLFFPLGFIYNIADSLFISASLVGTFALVLLSIKIPSPLLPEGVLGNIVGYLVVNLNPAFFLICFVSVTLRLFISFWENVANWHASKGQFAYWLWKPLIPFVTVPLSLPFLLKEEFSWSLLEYYFSQKLLQFKRFVIISPKIFLQIVGCFLLLPLILPIFMLIGPVYLIFTLSSHLSRDLYSLKTEYMMRKIISNLNILDEKQFFSIVSKIRDPVLLEYFLRQVRINNKVQLSYDEITPISMLILSLEQSFRNGIKIRGDFIKKQRLSWNKNEHDKTLWIRALEYLKWIVFYVDSMATDTLILTSTDVIYYRETSPAAIKTYNPQGNCNEIWLAFNHNDATHREIIRDTRGLSPQISTSLNSLLDELCIFLEHFRSK
jgi:hypothetical protein